jgi:hypothetical protein
MALHVLRVIVVIPSANEALPVRLQSFFLVNSQPGFVHFGYHLLCDMTHVPLQELFSIFDLIAFVCFSHYPFDS